MCSLPDLLSCLSYLSVIYMELRHAIFIFILKTSLFEIILAVVSNGFGLNLVDGSCSHLWMFSCVSQPSADQMPRHVSSSCAFDISAHLSLFDELKILLKSDDGSLLDVNYLMVIFHKDLATNNTKHISNVNKHL